MVRVDLGRHLGRRLQREEQKVTEKIRSIFLNRVDAGTLPPGFDEFLKGQPNDDSEQRNRQPRPPETQGTSTSDVNQGGAAGGLNFGNSQLGPKKQKPAPPKPHAHPYFQFPANSPIGPLGFPLELDLARPSNVLPMYEETHNYMMWGGAGPIGEATIDPVTREQYPIPQDEMERLLR
ncbi:hypothetical protein BU23DRAFT_242128 [Bimuria novae-zelandiae CBS 107.79]|uniref:Uncharacterized protein n=1 Tax=Bimuria novae-zelandiae CBS 107.79 TaxID=1447943 RepID=A0A6A5UWY0_9PLEO|nr:hypothetical protein BU23DRAFT_242128 [Bimuria novae-zelandiae CBS 107.79]